MIDKMHIKRVKIDFDPPNIDFGEIIIERSMLPLRMICPNGYGKTSLIFALLNIIPGFISGRVDLDGLYTDNVGNVYDFQTLNSITSVIPQSWYYGLLGFKTMDEIKCVKANDKDWTEYVIDKLSIKSMPNIPSNLLSDGEKKRLMIARSLLMKKKLILSDEWREHLDEEWLYAIDVMFYEYVKDGGFHVELDCRGYESNYDYSEIYVADTDDYLNDENQLIKLKDKLINKFSQSSISKDFVFKINDTEYKYEGGNLVQIIGKNGSGKTSLLKRLWKKFNKSGSYIYIPTDPIYHLIGPTIGDEIERNIGLYNEDIIDAICLILKKAVNADVLSLSFGNRKVLAIMMALMSKYSVIAVDEGFSGLDVSKKKILLEFIKVSLSYNKIIIITSQRKITDIESEEVIL